MRKIRLFIAGTHNQLTFSNEDIKAIYQLSIANPSEKIPFVLGHPENNLPIFGWIERNKIQLYEEADKTAIGFDRKDAEFSEGSIDALKQLKNDKISIKLEDKVITHIGLVKKAAVKENNDQTFSAETNTGVLCFSEDFQFESDKETLEDVIVRKFNQLFNKNQNSPIMDPNEQKIKDLEAKVAAFEAKETKGAENQKIKDLEAKVAEFSAKEKDSLKSELKAKVEALKLDEATAKSKIEFGEKLIAQDTNLFKEWIQEVKPNVVVTNGSVTHQFSKTNTGEEKTSVKDEIANEYAALKK